MLPVTYSLAQEVRDISFAFDTTDAVALSGTWLSRSPRIGLPVEMEVCGEYLLVADYYHPVHLLNRHSGAYLTSVGHTGQDPAGWQSPGFITCDTKRPHEAAWLYDAQLRRYRYLSIPAIMQDSTAFGEPYVSLTGFPGLPITPFWLSDSLLGIYGPSSTRFRWATMTAEGIIVRWHSPLPFQKRYPEVLPRMLQVALLAHGAVNPAHTRLVLGVGKVDLLEIYDTSSGAGVRLHGPFGWEPAFRRIGGRLMPLTRHRAYVDIATTDEAIYALFSGQPPDPENIADEGCFVFVFSYEGDFLSGYRLDTCGTALAVVRESGRVVLYLAAQSPEPGIRTYHLSAE